MKITETNTAAAELTWHKSSYSGAEGGDCVEVATRANTVHVRDSKVRTGPILSVVPGCWVAFMEFAAQN